MFRETFTFTERFVTRAAVLQDRTMESTGFYQAQHLARKISIARNRGATSGEALQSDSHTSVPHQSWIERKISKLSQPETADNWVAPETSRKLLARLPLPHDDMLSGAARAALHVRLAVLQQTERLRRKLDAEQIDSIITGDEHATTLLFASLLPRQIPKVTRTHPNPTREFDHAEALLRDHAQLLQRYVQMLGTASLESQEERPWESTELGSLHQLLSASREARAAAAHMVPFGEEAEQQDKHHLSAPAASGAAAAVATSCLAESRAARAFAETSLRGATEC